MQIQIGRINPSVQRQFTPLGSSIQPRNFTKSSKLRIIVLLFSTLFQKPPAGSPLKDHVDPLFPDSSGGNWAFFGQMRHISDPRHFCLDFSGQSIPIGNQQTIGLGFSPRKIGIFTLLVF